MLQNEIPHWLNYTILVKISVNNSEINRVVDLQHPSVFLIGFIEFIQLIEFLKRHTFLSCSLTAKPSITVSNSLTR